MFLLSFTESRCCGGEGQTAARAVGNLNQGAGVKSNPLYFQCSFHPLHPESTRPTKHLFSSPPIRKMGMELWSPELGLVQTLPRITQRMKISLHHSAFSTLFKRRQPWAQLYMIFQSLSPVLVFISIQLKSLKSSQFLHISHLGLRHCHVILSTESCWVSVCMFNLEGERCRKFCNLITYLGNRRK